MPEQNQRKLGAKLSAFASEYNATEFLIKQVISQSVSTAIPVRVDSVQRAGDGSGALYVSATPLVGQTDPEGNLLPPVSIPRLPYFRLQHGSAAVICDPAVGDIGLAIFAQSDCSRLAGGTEPVAPQFFRSFDMSDGFYIGGFWGKKPETYIRLEAGSGAISIKCKTLAVTCETLSVSASAGVTIDTPSVTVSGDVVASGVSLKNHTHGGVERGGNNTNSPN